MDTNQEGKTITIRDAVIELETCRSSTIISYIGAQNALIGPEDAGVLVDAIERVIPENGKIEKLDLFLHSPGGFIDPAYKLVRICKEYSKEFNVIIPLAAKSAATIICLGANEIVMTSLSELGPIDPIIQHPYKPEVRVPARSIKDFFQFLNSTEGKEKIIVDSSFKEKMACLLDPYLIGSYQTALESSKQIARLLLSETNLQNTPQKLDDAVHRLSDYYYSHSFVIDRQTAKDIGLNVRNAEEDKNLVRSIRQLFNIYIQFMQSNNIIKLIGNREINHHFKVNPPIVPETNKVVNLKF